MDNKTIIITGSSGFIGSRLTNLLGDVFPTARIVRIDRIACSGGPKTVIADLLDPNTTFRIIEEIRPDYIFHLAGAIYIRDWRELYRSNVETTVGIMEAVIAAGIPCRVVIPGSAAEYGRIAATDLPLSEKQIPNPIVPYGVAKVWQTTVARYYSSLGCEVVIGRLFNIIGAGAPEGLSVGTFANQLEKIRRGELPPKISVGNVRSKRDFIDVVDACRGLIALAARGKSGEIYNICSGSSFSMEWVLRMMIERAGLDVEVAVDPQRLKRMDIDDIFGTNEKIKADTGWSPSVLLHESIAAIVNRA